MPTAMHMPISGRMRLQRTGRGRCASDRVKGCVPRDSRLRLVRPASSFAKATADRSASDSG